MQSRSGLQQGLDPTHSERPAKYVCILRASSKVRCRDRKNCTLLIKHAGRGATGMAGRGPFVNDVLTEGPNGDHPKSSCNKGQMQTKGETKRSQNFADIIYEWRLGRSVFALRAAFLWHSTGIRIRPLFQAFIVLGKRRNGGREDREKRK